MERSGAANGGIAMKLRICMLFIFAGSNVGSALHAYTFSFTNHTNFALNIRIKLSGVLEPWSEEQVIASKNDIHGLNKISFEVGGRKIGFCLSKIEVSAPRFNLQWAPAVVQWVEGEAGEKWDNYMKLAEAIADKLYDLAKAIVYETASEKTLQQIETLQEHKKRAATAVTALAPYVNASPDDLKKMATKEVVKQVQERFIMPNVAQFEAQNPELMKQKDDVKRLMADLFIDDLDISAQTESAIKKITTGEFANTIEIETDEGTVELLPTSAHKAHYQTIAELVKKEDLRLSDVVHVIGTLIKYSWCKSLHFDIVDDKGIKFLMRVGQ